MTTRLRAAPVAMIVALLQAGPLLAQSAPVPDAATTPAPAASPAPAATPAPAPSPPAAADKAGASEGQAAASGEPAKPKAPKRIRMSAQTRHEIEHSLKTGTVPSRYRSQVPKEYQKYIPFAR